MLAQRAALVMHNATYGRNAEMRVSACTPFCVSKYLPTRFRLHAIFAVLRTNNRPQDQPEIANGTSMAIIG